MKLLQCKFINKDSDKTQYYTLIKILVALRICGLTPDNLDTFSKKGLYISGLYVIQI